MGPRLGWGGQGGGGGGGAEEKKGPAEEEEGGAGGGERPAAAEGCSGVAPSTHAHCTRAFTNHRTELVPWARPKPGPSLSASSAARSSVASAPRGPPPLPPPQTPPSPRLAAARAARNSSSSGPTATSGSRPAARARRLFWARPWYLRKAAQNSASPHACGLAAYAARTHGFSANTWCTTSGVRVKVALRPTASVGGASATRADDRPGRWGRPPGPSRACARRSSRRAAQNSASDTAPADTRVSRT